MPTMTLKVEVTYSGQITVTPDYGGAVVDRDAEIEKAFDGTMRELVKLGVMDPSVAGSIASGDIEITLAVKGKTVPEIIDYVDGIIRSALHAAGVGTHGWSTERNLLSADFQKIEVDDAKLAEKQRKQALASH